MDILLYRSLLNCRGCCDHGSRFLVNRQLPVAYQSIHYALDMAQLQARAAFPGVIQRRLSARVRRINRYRADDVQ